MNQFSFLELMLNMRDDRPRKRVANFLVLCVFALIGAMFGWGF